MRVFGSVGYAHVPDQRRNKLNDFGSVGYAHVPDQRRNKLNDKSMKLVFIGYGERSKAYKLYNPIEKKLISSRDVYINEQSGWDWKKQEELEIEEVKEQSKVMIPISNTVISRSVRDEEAAEITRNGEASSSRSSESKEESENEDEPRQPVIEV
jgi:hypothetical protein